MKRYNITHPNHTHLEIVSVNVQLDSDAFVSYCLTDENITYSIKRKIRLAGEDYNSWGTDDCYVVGKVMENEGITEYSEQVQDGYQ